MTNAATRLHDFAEAGALKEHVKKLEAQLGPERGLGEANAMEDGSALESELEQVNSAVAALEG